MMECNRQSTVSRHMPSAAVMAAALAFAGIAAAQVSPPPANQQLPQAAASATPPAVRITLDRAIELALQHNHTLLATRTTINQARADEITANLRPNPLLSWDVLSLPVFQPNQFSADYLKNTAQYDVGVSYLIERGKKRQARLEAAKDQTAVTTATVSDTERTIVSGVAQQFINVLQAEANFELSQANLQSFQQTVQASEARFQSGAISEGDLLKIRLQLLQFQMDVNSAQLARVQALASLRQLLGFESVPENYDVEGNLAYQAVSVQLDDLKALALRNRPDLQAAQFGVTAAQSQYSLARAEGKQDLDTGFSYSHINGVNTGSFFFNIPLPVFNRNQGEIARTQFAVTRRRNRRTQPPKPSSVMSSMPMRTFAPPPRSCLSMTPVI